MWFIGVEVEQENSAPPPKKNSGSALGLIETTDFIWVQELMADPLRYQAPDSSPVVSLEKGEKREG